MPPDLPPTVPPATAHARCQRLRPDPTTEQLAAVYVERPQDRWMYGLGYHRRVATMLALAARHGAGARSVADLSAGNGLIGWTVGALLGLPAADIHLGDIHPGHRYTGPLEQTLQQIPAVDLFVSGETLEHVPDPAGMLAAIGGTARALLLSTPVDNWGDENPEHLWAWDTSHVEGLLDGAGWTPVAATMLDTRCIPGERYRYGLWYCR